MPYHWIPDRLFLNLTRAFQPVLIQAPEDIFTPLVSGLSEENTVENPHKSKDTNILPGEKSTDSDSFDNLRSSFETDHFQTGVVDNEPIKETPEQSEESEEQAEIPMGTPPEEIPDWLRTLGDTKEKTSVPTVEGSRDELPAWLQDFEQQEDQIPGPPPPFTVPPAKQAPTKILQSGDAGSGFIEETKAPKQEEINIPGESTEEILPQEMAVPSQKPIIQSKTAESPFSQADVTQGDDEERPAWLSKLIGIDDVEIPTVVAAQKKSEEEIKYPGIPENLEDIPGATQAAWIVDAVSGKAAGGKVGDQTADIEKATEIPPDEEQVIEASTISESTPLSTKPEPPAIVVPEDVISSEPGEGEPVPDLSLIVEGLQAAWMSEHAEDADMFKGIPSDSMDLSSQNTKSDTTIVIQPVEDQVSKEKEPQTKITEPVVDEIVGKEAVIPQPVVEQKQARVARHVPAPEMIPPNTILDDARKAFSHGVLDESLDRYVDLINRNRLIDDVIEDLVSMTTTHPDDSYIWQTLGDAFIRKNKLDSALSAYHRAEDLLK